MLVGVPVGGGVAVAVGVLVGGAGVGVAAGPKPGDWFGPKIGQYSVSFNPIGLSQTRS